jgi:sulfhydrogenase subunit beta (sulfur reductase)
LAEPALAREQVLFGVRPCDARGLRALDALLLDRPPPDSYYAERRARTTLVGLACPRLWEDCFCTSLGSALDDASDVDVMLYEGEPGYWVAVVTEKGAALLEGLELEETDQVAPVSDASGEQVPVLPPEAWGARFDHVYWQRLTERCLSCHACTYVCPTCRCFDVRDDTVADDAGYAHIQRLRAWDSCMAPAYRRIAGGHNPRPTRAQRLRNRYYCKFCYSPLDFGAVACVGCGRCIAACPVSIDIAEMLADVARLDAGD